MVAQATQNLHNTQNYTCTHLMIKSMKITVQNPKCS